MSKKCYDCGTEYDSDNWDRDESGYAFDICPRCGLAGDYIEDSYNWELNRDANIKYNNLEDDYRRNEKKIRELTKQNEEIKIKLKNIEDGIDIP